MPSVVKPQLNDNVDQLGSLQPSNGIEPNKSNLFFGLRTDIYLLLFLLQTEIYDREPDNNHDFLALVVNPKSSFANFCGLAPKKMVGWTPKNNFGVLMAAASRA